MIASRLILFVPALLAGTRGTAAQLSDSTVAVAASALARFDSLCASPAAALWGVSLCGPIVLVEPSSRSAVTNRRPAWEPFTERTGVFTGALPARIEIANTATEWDGTRWTMLMLPLPRDSFDRVRLMVHESFHRIQARVGVPMVNVVITALDERDARYWLRAELRALSAVQRDTNLIAAREAARDALLFRDARHALFAGIDSLEATLELSEGLAEYSGVVVAARAHGMSLFDAAEWARRNFERLPTFVRSYGYGVGPGLGLALDRLDAGWRDRVATIHSLGGELARAAAWRAPRVLLDSARSRVARYDGAAIGEEEDQRAAVRATQQAEYRARLVDGPVVVFRQASLGGAFNPNTIVPLGDAGLVYPRRTVNAEWGELTVTSGGLLVSSDRTLAFVSAAGIEIDSTGARAHGAGWELTLSAGWKLVRSGRAGDLAVVREISR